MASGTIPMPGGGINTMTLMNMPLGNHGVIEITVPIAYRGILVIIGGGDAQCGMYLLRSNNSGKAVVLPVLAGEKYEFDVSTPYLIRVENTGAINPTSLLVTFNPAATKPTVTSIAGTA